MAVPLKFEELFLRVLMSLTDEELQKKDSHGDLFAKDSVKLLYMNIHKLFIPCHPQTRCFQVNVKLKILDQNAIQFKLLTYMRASANVAWGTG